MTPEQLALLKADILAATDQATVDARTIRNDVLLAELYNAPASPTYTAWRSSLSPEQARDAITSGDGLAQLDNLTAGKRDSLLWAFAGVTYPANAVQRAAIENLCGSQAALKSSILVAQKRTVSRAERIFATGIGSDASPGTLGWEGMLSHPDISAALNG